MMKIILKICKLCDICLKLFKDTINIQLDYMQDFNERYYGENGVRSQEVIQTSLDSKWIGLSIDVLMEDCEEEEWNIGGIKVNVLNNDDIMNEGKIEFIQLFHHYLEKCKDSKFEKLFEFDDLSIIKSFILLKKHMKMYY